MGVREVRVVWPLTTDPAAAHRLLQLSRLDSDKSPLLLLVLLLVLVLLLLLPLLLLQLLPLLLLLLLPLVLLL